MTELTDMQQDFLKELANIGIGHAATSLGKMVHADVDITLPEMRMVSLLKIFDNQDSQICATSTGIEGALNGYITIVFSDTTCFWLIDKMYGNAEGTTRSFTPEGVAALKEFCNIIGGAFLTALSNLTKLDFMPQIPSIVYGQGNEIFKDFSKTVMKDVDDSLSVKTQLIIGSKNIDGDLFLVLNKESFAALFKKMLG